MIKRKLNNNGYELFRFNWKMLSRCSLYVVCENGDLKGQTTVKTAVNNVPLRQHIESVLLIFPKICSKNEKRIMTNGQRREITFRLVFCSFLT